MTYKRIVIIGASGTIGSQLHFAAVEKNLPVIGSFNKAAKAGLIKFDLLNQSITEAVPDIGSNDTVVILAAAIDPNWVYNNPVHSQKLNVDATKRCIDDCLNVDAHVIFMSSEAVFSEDKPEGYSETDITSPATTYARQKVDVEHYISKTTKTCIVRTGRNVSWLNNIGYCPISLTYNALLTNNAQMGTDNVITLTDVRDTAAGILNIAIKSISGTVHLVAAPPITRTELADRIIATSRYGNEMTYQAVKFSDLNFSEKRSCCAWLKTDVTSSQIGLSFRPPLETIKTKVAYLDTINSLNHQ